jgi:hypothetical protein
MSKRDLQADVVAAWVLIQAEMYGGLNEGYMRTREVMDLFNCHRSTATRIMDHCELHNALLYVDAIYIGNGRYGKAVVGDIGGLRQVCADVWHQVWVNAHRARKQLSVSYVTLDSIRALAGAAYDRTA